MARTFERAEALAKEYNAIKTDKERLLFLKNHNQEMKVVLDNDLTMVEFIKHGEYDLRIDEIDLNSFDNYHGWQDAVVELFEFAGITAEQC